MKGKPTDRKACACRHEAMEIPGWKFMATLLSVGVPLRSYVATHTLAAMLANPQFEPVKKGGEDAAQAYARRAADYADALVNELERRSGAAKEKAG